MKRLLCILTKSNLLLIFLFSLMPTVFAQDKTLEESLPKSKPSWKNSAQHMNVLGMEAWGNTGNLIDSYSTDIGAGNSYAWEIYYTASIPKYDWISIGAGFEFGGSVGINNEGTVIDRTDNSSYYYVFQAYLNVSPWFTLNFNSDGRMQFRFRYTANFKNPISDSFGHFLLTELRFGFFLPGNEINVNTGGIDKFWIDSPSIEFLYYAQFHKNVAFRGFAKFLVNNGLFYKSSGITPQESVPMEFYARLDFILSPSITLWTRVQWNIYNSDFNAYALYPNKNPYDLQLRAGLVLLMDLNKKKPLV